MKFFISALCFVSILTWLSGYYALYTPKISRPSNVVVYQEEFLERFNTIEEHLSHHKFEEALTLCNEVILSATDKKTVAKAYYLRSKANHLLNENDSAKKDLLYAKEIDYETFKIKATYSFVKSLRDFQLYESELFSGNKKNINKELIYSLYYGIGLLCALCLIVLYRTNRELIIKEIPHAKNK